MHVHCTHCGRRIPAEDLNITTGIAKCNECDAVFDFTEALAEHAEAHRTGRRERSPVALPPGLREDNRGGALRFVRRWFAPHIVFMLFFCIAWDAFLVFWYTMATSDDDVPWIMIVFPIAHVAVGIGMTYYTACGFVNRTIFELDGHRLRIAHGPLPWWGNHDIEAHRVRQLYCKQKSHRSDDSTHHTFELWSVLADGTSLKLLDGLHDPDQALYLEQRFEDALGLADERVRGEYRG